jgi:hypothetical protein
MKLYYLTLIFSVLCLGVVGQVDSTAMNDVIEKVKPGTIRLGIQVSPVSSSLSSNDNTITSDGSNAGMRIGLIGEKYFTENYAILGSFSVVTNQGGTLMHQNGGNYFPKSNLSDPDLNTGQKPLPDGSRLTYHVNYLEFTTGLKLKTKSIGNKRGIRIYADLPMLGAAIALKSSGDIEGSGIDLEGENVGKDLRNILLFWGAGGGIDLTLKNGLTLVGGVSYTQSFTDVTRNNGSTALDLLDDKGTTDPSDDEYQIRDENSRSLLKGLSLKLGLIF